jgi:hypothetical protein
MPFIAELWVLRDSDYDEAARLVAQRDTDENAT